MFGISRWRISIRLAAIFICALAPIVWTLGVAPAALGQEPSAGPVEVSQAVQHDVSPPLRSMPVAGPGTDHRREMPLRLLPQSPPGQSAPDPVVQTTAGPQVATTGGLNFAGVGNGDYGFSPNAAPPDTNGVAGATQYVQWVNESFAVFDKATGALVYGPVAGNTLWAGFGGSCQTNNDGDPIVQYDKAANRWVFTQFSVSSTPYLQCVAVSTTSDATGTYNRYAFNYGNTQFPDYPKLGVWPDAYYITFNIFNHGVTFAGAKLCAYDRAAMLSGAAATQQCFQLSNSYGGVLPADFDGTTPPPVGSPNFLLNFGNNSLNEWKFHVDWSNSANTTLTGPTNIPVAAFTAACNGGTCIPQLGTSQVLDSLADRLMYRLAYRNLGDHESLVVNHSVTAGSSVGVRWYELRSPNATPTVFQQGTYAPDANYRWMGSIAMDRAGDIALGYSVSSGSMKPAIRYTGRVPTDTLGTLQAENTIINGAGAQLTSLSRWGDYSAMSVDPVDDCTFFYTNEYLKADGTFNWSTRVGSFKFPQCTPLPNGTLSGTVSASINGSPISGSLVTAVNAPGTGIFAARTNAAGAYRLIGIPVGAYTVTASASGYVTASATGVTVSNGVTTTQNFSLSSVYSVTLAPPASSGNASAGASARYTLTLTNSGIATDTFGLSVSGNAWLTTAPASIGPLAPGAAVTFTVSVTVPGGAANGASDTANVLAASQANAAVTAGALVTTTAVAGFGVYMTPSAASGSAQPGAVVTYTLRVTNTGSIIDTYALSVSGNAWPTVAPASVGPLAGGAATSFTVAVTVPAGTLAGASDIATLTATSQGNAAVSAASVLTTSAAAVRGVQLSPTLASGSAVPGAIVTYTLRVTNTGNASDTFTVTVSGNAWPTTAPASAGPLAAGSTTTFVVSVTVPAGTLAGAFDTAFVAVTSHGDNTATASAALTTTALPTYGAQLSPTMASASAPPGTVVTYTLRVTNTGNASDTFTVTVTGNAWPTLAPASVGPLAAGGSTTFAVTVTVPASALAGASDPATVTATSRGNAAVSAASTLTTTASAVRGVQLSPAVASGSAVPGAVVTYTLRVTNTGNASDTFTVTVSGNAWPTVAPASVGPLGAGSANSFVVTVTVPAGTLAGASDSASVTVKSQADGTTSASASVTTTALATYGVQIRPSAASSAAVPDAVVTYTLRVTNTGNTSDTFTVTVSGNAWPTLAPASAGPLAAGGSTALAVTVTVPAGALAGASDVATVTATSRGNAAVSAASTLTTTAAAVRGVQLSPTLASGFAVPGAVVTYTLRVTNTGNASDTFTVTVSGNAWPTLAPASAGPLAAGSTTTFVVTVTVPAGTLAGAFDTAFVAVTSHGDNTATASAGLTTTAFPVYGVQLRPTTASGSALPGAVVTYTLRLTNTGNTSDTFTVTVTGNAWPTQAPASIGALAAGVASPLLVTVTVPGGALADATDSTIVTATSQGNPAVSAASALTTTASAVRGVQLSPTLASGSAVPGAVVTYTLRMTNTGNASDTFTVTVSGNAWPTLAPSSVSLLGAGSSTTFVVTVTVPGGTLAGVSDTASVTVKSQGDGTTSASATLTTTALPIYGVQLRPTTASGATAPGAVVTYTLRVTNTGNIVDTYALSVSGNAWPTVAPASSGPLAAGVTTSFIVTVTVPGGALAGVSDSATVTATSQGNPVVSTASVLTTTAAAVRGVQLSPTLASGSALPGAVVTYTLRVTNTGNASDTFTVTVSGNAWPTQAPTSVGALAAGGTASFLVTVTVPAGTLAGAFDTAFIAVTSHGDSATTASAALTTTALPTYGVQIRPTTASASVLPGAVVTYTLRLTNTGNASDTFTVTVSGNAWPTLAPASIGPLAAGAATSFSVAVTVPMGTLAGASDVAAVTATSQGNSAVSAASTLTTTSAAVRGVQLSPTLASSSAPPGAVVTYTLRVTNTGNASDTFTVTVSDNAWPTQTPNTVGPLAAGGSTSFVVTVTVPAGALAGASDAATLTATSQGNNSVSAFAALTTTALPSYGVQIRPTTANGSALPGAVVTYTLRVTNTGNASDTFTVTVSGNAWPTTSPASAGPLAAGNGSTVVVTVTVPVSALVGTIDVASVTAISHGNASVSAFAALTTTASAVRGVQLSPTLASGSAAPGAVVTYTLRVTNTGNASDTFTVTVSGNAWPALAPASVSPLAAGGSTSFVVTASVPIGALAGASDVATVTATSQGNPVVSASSTLTTTAAAGHGLTLSPASAAGLIRPGTILTYTLRLTNTGNVGDTYILGVSGNTWATIVASPVGPLAAGQAVDVTVAVSVPADAVPGSSDSAIVTATSQGDGAFSASATLTTTAAYPLFLPIIMR